MLYIETLKEPQLSMDSTENVLQPCCEQVAGRSLGCGVGRLGWARVQQQENIASHSRYYSSLQSSVHVNFEITAIPRLTPGPAVAAAGRR